MLSSKSTITHLTITNLMATSIIMITNMKATITRKILMITAISMETMIISTMTMKKSNIRNVTITEMKI